MWEPNMDTILNIVRQEGGQINTKHENKYICNIMYFWRGYFDAKLLSSFLPGPPLCRPLLVCPNNIVRVSLIYIYIYIYIHWSPWGKNVLPDIYSPVPWLLSEHHQNILSSYECEGQRDCWAFFYRRFYYIDFYIWEIIYIYIIIIYNIRIYIYRYQDKFLISILYSPGSGLIAFFIVSLVLHVHGNIGLLSFAVWVALVNRQVTHGCTETHRHSLRWISWISLEEAYVRVYSRISVLIFWKCWRTPSTIHDILLNVLWPLSA